jgi:superfamily II DNA/RNA helicase
LNQKITSLGAKMNYLIDYCQEQVDKNSPLLILSTRSETFLEPLAQILTKKNIEVGLITGEISMPKREIIIKEFQNGQLNILLANLQCIG